MGYDPKQLLDLPLEWRIAKGMDSHSIVHINAYTTTLSATASLVLSPINKYAMTTPSVVTASTQYMRLTSSDAADATGGTGAINVTIVGIDESGNLLTETVAISGQTPKTTTGKFIAINESYVSSVGSGGINAGTIYITGNEDSTTAGVPDATSTSYSVIGIGAGRNGDARYLIPAGYTGYIRYVAMGQNLTTGDTQIKSYKKESGKPKQLVNFNIADNRQPINNIVPIKLPEKTYWWAEATGAASATSVDLGVELILVNNVD